MILVAGGTGLLGRDVVGQLLAAGEAVRVLTRDAANASRVLGSDVEIVVGDVRRPESLVDAVGGTRTVVSAVHGFLGGRGAGPQAIDARGNAHLVAAAKAAGAEVVLLSVLGASPTSPLELFRAKYAAEDAVRSSGVAWTIVRPGAYLETWIAIMRDTAKKSGRPLIFGRGAQPIAFVCAHDVANVVSRAVTDTQLRGEVLEISGPRMTMAQLATAVQDADGRAGKARHIPRGALRVTSVLARAVNPAFARQNRAALVMDTVDLGAATSDAVARLELPSPRSLADVLSLPNSALR